MDLSCHSCQRLRFSNRIILAITACCCFLLLLRTEKSSGAICVDAFTPNRNRYTAALPGTAPSCLLTELVPSTMKGFRKSKSPQASPSCRKSKARSTRLSSSSGKASTNNIAPLSTVAGMLAKMTFYFASMVDPQINRFYYRCLPETGQRIHSHCPIRDLGSAWDTATLLNFLKSSETSEKKGRNDKIKQRLSAAVVATIDAYSGTWLTFTDSKRHLPCAALSSKLLEEPSSIAHSAFLILATTGALRLKLLDPETLEIPLEELVHGILSMQQEGTGAFAIRFGSGDIFHGIEFYPGEAMLALLDAYEGPNVLSPAIRQEILSAVQRAFLFYSDFYRAGNVDEHYTSFFGNWQVQSFAKLFDILHRTEQDSPGSSVNLDPGAKKTASGPWLPDESDATAANVANYVLELCDAVISSRSWKLLDLGRYSHLSTVEIACGLEALAEGTQVALLLDSSTTGREMSSDRVQLYWHHVRNAVQFLAAVQDQVPPEAAGYGGLGYGVNELEQRLDVTGHAVNALIKVSRVQEKASI